MRRNAHPLHPAEILPAPEPYQVDPLSEAVHSRGGTRVPPNVRALPTGTTTRSFPSWRWGRSVEPPRSTSTPQIFSPSDLEPGRTREDSTRSIADVVKRLSKR
jgi:hypothetical protein